MESDWDICDTDEGDIALGDSGCEVYVTTPMLVAGITEDHLEFSGEFDTSSVPLRIVAELMRRHGWTVTPPVEEQPPTPGREEREDG